MTSDSAPSSDPYDLPNRSLDDRVDGFRMSFGDHLEELRSCLIMALVGVVIFTVVALVWGKDILGIICLPLLKAQHANGLPPNLQVLAPTAAFTAYLKIGLLSGLILAMPWVLYQGWRFVGTGLYRHERRFMRLLVPTSSGLFVVGVLFLYFAVLPIVLHFFIRFNKSFGMTLPAPVAVSAESGGDGTTPNSQVDLLGRMPTLAEDPLDATSGDAWFNTTSRRLVVQTESGPYSLPLEQGTVAATMQSQFAIDFYVSFVLILALAFGIAFETPVVVFFLAWSGLVPTATMAHARRYVLLATVILAAILTPPDVISQLLLAIPIYLLFELGILAARTVERTKPQSG